MDTWDLHDTFFTRLNIRVYVPSTFFTAVLVITHDSHPYNKIDSTVVLKIRIFYDL